MAVLQSFRAGSLLGMVRSCLTPDAVHKAASYVGESESSTGKALLGGTASVLSGLTNMVSTSEGANDLGRLIRDGGYGSATGEDSSLFRGGGFTQNMLSAGTGLLGTIFGGKSSSVAQLLAKSSGVGGASATKLLSLCAPLVLGALGKRVASQELDSSGLATALLDEKADITAAAPSGLSLLLSGGPVAVPAVSKALHLEHSPVPELAAHSPVPELAAPEARRRSLRWLPLLLLGLGVTGLLAWLLRGRSVQPAAGDVASGGVSVAKNAIARVDLPGGGSVSVPQGSIDYELARFLADPSAQDLPKTFVFDHLNFESAGTQLTPDSVATVDNLARVLNAYPTAAVQLVGHADNTGSSDANQQLSLDRANAIKGMLVNQGVIETRISTTGLGESRPLASNDTEEGRASNRRTELTVTSK